MESMLTDFSAEELVRLKHSINQTITWGKSDLNAPVMVTDFL